MGQSLLCKSRCTFLASNLRPCSRYVYYMFAIPLTHRFVQRCISVGFFLDDRWMSASSHCSRDCHDCLIHDCTLSNDPSQTHIDATQHSAEHRYS